MTLFLIAATPVPQVQAHLSRLGDVPGAAARRPQRLLRRRRVRPGQGAADPARAAGGRGEPPGQAGAAHAPPPRRLSLRHPARHHPGEPGPGLGRRAGVRLDHPPPADAVRGQQPPSAPLDQRDDVLPGHHHPAHRARRAGPQDHRHPQGREHLAAGGLPALLLLQDHLSGDLAAQPRRQPAAQADRHPPGGRRGAGARRGGAAAAALLVEGQPALDAEARAARQHLRAVAPDGAADHAPPPGRGLSLDRAPAGGEPAARPPQRPYPLPALRGGPRPRHRPASTSRTSSTASAR